MRTYPCRLTALHPKQIIDHYTTKFKQKLALKNQEIKKQKHTFLEASAVSESRISDAFPSHVIPAKFGSSISFKEFISSEPINSKELSL